MPNKEHFIFVERALDLSRQARFDSQLPLLGKMWCLPLPVKGEFVTFGSQCY